jgi:hypothetical protein
MTMQVAQRGERVALAAARWRQTVQAVDSGIL